ncbi:hypothetical protein FQN54_002500 [Arachnomyces sp. PD_36]|nr:hypothetical protein FQN54_002500 [Arachnomyces sp. PD_36]
MDRPFFPEDLSQQGPSDYLPACFDPYAALDEYNDQPAPATQFDTTERLADGVSDGPAPGAPRDFPGLREAASYCSQPQAPQRPVGNCPWLSGHIPTPCAPPSLHQSQATQLNDIPAIRIDYENGAAFNPSTDHGISTLGMPLYSNLDPDGFMPVYSGGSNPHFIGTMSAPANPVSAESSGNALVQTPGKDSPRRNMSPSNKVTGLIIANVVANMAQSHTYYSKRTETGLTLNTAEQYYICSNAELPGLSAPEQAVDCRPANTSLNTPDTIPTPTSSQCTMNSPLGQSPEGMGDANSTPSSRFIVFDSKMDEVMVGDVRRRSEKEKKENRRLRDRGGACETCRAQHRKCKHRSDTIEGNSEVVIAHQPKGVESQPESPMSDKLSYGDFTHGLSGQIPSSGPREPQPLRSGELWAAQPSANQPSNVTNDIGATDEIQNIGFQFRGSAQYPDTSQDLGRDSLPDMYMYNSITEGFPQPQHNAMQFQNQYPLNNRMQHNMGSNPSPFPAYLHGGNLTGALESDSLVENPPEGWSVRPNPPSNR